MEKFRYIMRESVGVHFAKRFACEDYFRKHRNFRQACEARRCDVNLYRIGPRVRQTIRKLLGILKVSLLMKNEATPGSSGRVMVSSLMCDPPIPRTKIGSERVCLMCGVLSIRRRSA